jgi:GT2 family glycosyltransferase
MGAKFARSKVLVLLSNDVIIDGDFIEPLLTAIGESKTEVLCSPRIIDWEAGWNQFPPDVVIPYAEGWLLAMKTNTFAALGGFDSRYSPCDYEDMDLSYTAVSAGMKLKQIPLPVQHIGAATVGYTPERRAITESHRRIFAKKWNLIWAPVRD